MLSSSGSSKRLLVFHGSSPHRSTFSRKGVSTEKHNDTTTSCFGLEELNPENKVLVTAKTRVNVERSEADLRAALAAKDEMLEFYRKQQQRRKERFQKELSSRQATLTQTLNNLKNLVWIEAQKNFKLQRKIEALKSTLPQQEVSARRDQSNLLGYSDLNYLEISGSQAHRREDTLLLESMHETSSMTLNDYI